MNVMSGVALIFSILLTVADVILRSFRTPVVGTFELVAFSAAVVIGFSLPFTSWKKGHINVDSLVLKLPQAGKKNLKCHYEMHRNRIILDSSVGISSFWEWICVKRERFLLPFRYRFTPSPME